jgi:hypothetical protein
LIRIGKGFRHERQTMNENEFLEAAREIIENDNIYNVGDKGETLLHDLEDLIEYYQNGELK